MAYKIAVASSDGKVVNRHFGRAEQFLIFEAEGGRYEFLERRENIPSCVEWEHSDETLLYTVKLISDCKIVLASRIGPGAVELLSCYGIKALAIGDFIEAALEKVVRSEG